jgi:hypothetical protein
MAKKKVGSEIRAVPPEGTGHAHDEIIDAATDAGPLVSESPSALSAAELAELDALRADVATAKATSEANYTTLLAAIIDGQGPSEQLIDDILAAAGKTSDQLADDVDALSEIRAEAEQARRNFEALIYQAMDGRRFG